MNLAFVHEWLVAYAGSERVLAATADLYPDSPIYATLHDPRQTRGTPLENRRIHTTFLQKMPWALKRHRMYLPLMPYAVEQHDLSDYDVVFSSSHAVAKGVLTRTDQLHLSYVHTPMRYAWDLYFGYPGQGGRSRGVGGLAAKLFLHYLRLWDLASANRVDVFLANSRYIAKRIQKIYRRRAIVAPPPVDVDRFQPDGPREDFYLVVSRLTPYKRVDLIIEAFNQSGLPLLIIGDGPERERLERLAKPPIQFLGHLDDAQVADHMQRCKCFVFAALEDFGIAPVEAMAAGAPVIAYGRGGAAETVVDGVTGYHFHRQSPDELIKAIRRFEDLHDRMPAEAIRGRAEKFSTANFQTRIRAVIDNCWESFNQGRHVTGDHQR